MCAATTSLLEPVPPAIAGDIAFYCRLCDETDGPVLEIGCGTGRVSLALAEAGHDLVGIDLSEAMLTLARDKVAAGGLEERIAFRREDMRDFDLGQRFGLVLVPYRTFLLLISPEDQRQALAAFRRHMTDDARLVLHLFDPDMSMLLPGSTIPRAHLFGSDCFNGRKVEALLQETDFDHVAQHRCDHWRYRAFDDAGAVVEEEMLTLSLRWAFRWEMHHLLALAGFTVEGEYSDFDGAAPAYGKEADLGLPSGRLAWYRVWVYLESMAREIDPAGLRALLTDGDEFALLDPRPADAFQAGHLLQAVNLPVDAMAEAIERLVPRRSTRIALYDDDGATASQASALLAARGYDSINLLRGGLQAWRAAGFSLFGGTYTINNGFALCAERHYDTPTGFGGGAAGQARGRCLRPGLGTADPTTSSGTRASRVR